MTTERIKQAKRDMRAFRKIADPSPDVPTPERIVQADGGYVREAFAEVAEVTGRDGVVTTQLMNRHRLRMQDTPLGRLKSHHLLAPGDEYKNLTMAMAGERYYGHWLNAHSGSGGGTDPARGSSNSGLPPAFFNTAAQLQSWQSWNAARANVYPPHRLIVDAVVLEEIEPLEAGRKFTIYTNRDQAIAVCLDRLRAGLIALAVHFRIFEPDSSILRPRRKKGAP
jgi:hypothetical protein